MTDTKALSEILFPDIEHDSDYYEALYVPRDLKENAKVTRFAPSPTGFVHFGSMFPVLVSERLAHQSDGIFYLRIEDTDGKRYVEGAVDDMINVYEYFGIHFDESLYKGGKYAPYVQSERKDIYRAFAKKLVAEGNAYPCFCSEDELNALREQQESEKVVTGYYGKYVRCRDLSFEEVKSKIDAGIPWTLRFKSFGDSSKKVKFTDLIKGGIEITENDIDHILLKSDGMPTYHLAHAVDDHLMGTTHVVRGEEWLPSLPYHIQIFKALNFKLPKYLHISQLMKLDNGVKKKLSKRDAEAGMSYYISGGYPSESVVEYIMTMLNSNFEEWRSANKTLPVSDFPFSIKKMSASGTLFDIVKLNDISKNVIGKMTAGEIMTKLIPWSKQFDSELYELINRSPEYVEKILSIGRNTAKPRKDFATWRDIIHYISYFYDDKFRIEDTVPSQFQKSDICDSLKKFLQTYNTSDNQTEWFDKIKIISSQLGYSPDVKAYKAAPENFKGHVGDISSFIRIAVCGRVNTPDLYEIMKLLGYERVCNRIKQFIEAESKGN